MLGVCSAVDCLWRLVLVFPIGPIGVLVLIASRLGCVPGNFGFTGLGLVFIVGFEGVACVLEV